VALSLTDLFVIGLALDISGAALLAKGLLLPPRMINVLSGSYWSYNARDAVNRVRDRIDAEFGVAALLAGFGLQAAAYVLVLLGVESPDGTGEAIVAVVLGVLAAGATFGVWRYVRPRRIRALLVRVALAHQGNDTESDEDRPGWTRKKAAMLLDYGQAAGYAMLPGEGESGKEAYAKRVFGIALPSEDI
jgi:hypothetical protein